MTYDVLVVGLGAVGSAALAASARLGARALGLDRFSPPHTLGSSHGETRITREATAEGAAYVPLVRRSNELWRDLEAWSGEELHQRTGALIIGNERAGNLDFAGRSEHLARQFGVPHEHLGARDVTRRFPTFHLQGEEHAYFEPNAGLLFPEKCVTAHLRQATAHGADLLTDTRVTALEDLGDRVRVTTDRGTFEGGRAVVCAGPWTRDLLGESFERIARVYRQVLCWFDTARPELYDCATTPVFIWQHGPGDAHFYGFPEVTRGSGVKVATEQLHRSDTPDGVPRDVDPRETHDLFERHVAGRLEGLSSHARRAQVCLYTVTADGAFLLDEAPGSPNVVVVSACSGHGFKHSPAVGEAAARRALDRSALVDVTPFSWTARPAFPAHAPRASTERSS